MHYARHPLRYYRLPLKTTGRGLSAGLLWATGKLHLSRARASENQLSFRSEPASRKHWQPVSVGCVRKTRSLERSSQPRAGLPTAAGRSF
jgi:hypothetical protein